jgi:ABC-type multidrug transport system fused ATPase/permease subunit
MSSTPLVLACVRAILLVSAISAAALCQKKSRRTEPLLQYPAPLSGHRWTCLAVAGSVAWFVASLVAFVDQYAVTSALALAAALNTVNAGVVSAAVITMYRRSTTPHIALPAWLFSASVAELLLLAVLAQTATVSNVVTQSVCNVMLWILTTYAVSKRSLPLPPFDPQKPETFGCARGSPLVGGSVWQQISFSWVTPVLRAGLKETLSKNHLYDLTPSQEVNFSRGVLLPAFQLKTASKRGQTNGHESGILVRAMYHAWWRQFWLAGLLHFFEMAMLFVQPVMLNRLIHYFTDPDASLSTGIAYTIFLVGGMLVGACCCHHFNFRMSLLGMSAKGATSALVFEKALRLSQPAAQKHTAGQIASIMNVDCERLSYAAYFIHFIWSMPLVFAVAMYFVWCQLGLASLAAVALMVSMAPLNKKIAKMFMRFSLKVSEERDIRVGTFSEVNSAVKFVKLLTWEEKVYNLVDNKRERELKQLYGMKNVGILAQLLFVVVPLLLPLVGFGTFYLLSLKSGQVLDPARAFTSLAIFSVLYVPINLIPITAQFLAGMFVSIKRIADLLFAEERSQIEERHDNEDSEQSIPHGYSQQLVENGYKFGTMTMHGVAVRWQPPVPVADAEGEDEEEDEPTLTEVLCQRLARQRHAGGSSLDEELCAPGGSVDAQLTPTLRVDSLKFPQGGLTMIVGRVGSGKSTLLAALLNEVPLLEGSIRVCGSTAFCAQQPWVMHGSVRDNILFKKPMDRKRYAATIRNCSLERDIASLDQQDLTVVGERGVGLSGGQKARLSLARAVYADKDNVILDDVLSAVDAHVGEQLVRHVLVGGDGIKAALHGKTRVLVTHQTQWLPYADLVVVVHEGRIAGAGSYKDLLEQGLVDMVQNAEEPSGIDEEDDKQTNLVLDFEAVEQDIHSGEDREEGTVSLKVWKTYARTLGTKTTFVVLVCFLIAEVTNDFANVTLSIWTAQGSEASSSLSMMAMPWPYGIQTQLGHITSTPVRRLLGTDASNESTSMLLFGAYAALLLLSSGFIMFRSFFMRNASMAASRTMHRSALWAVLRAPMEWHYATPNGQKINRFTADQREVDEDLQGSTEDVLRNFFSFIGCCAVVIFVNPLVAIGLPVIAILYYFVQRLYRSGARELQRLESLARSPVTQRLEEAISGKMTIVAKHQEHSFCADNIKRMNQVLTCKLLNEAARRWLALRLNLLSSAIVLMVSVCALTQRGSSIAHASVLALSLKYAVQLTDVMNSIVQSFVFVELGLIALERIESYTQLPSEAPLVAEGANALANSRTWLGDAELAFVDVVMRYGPELKPALKGVNFRIPGGSSVGVVGRTGAGKTSLLAAAFRLHELSAGKILLGGTDISTLSLHQLRGCLAIIPQDPVLFACPMRQNLDPFNEHSDEELKEQCRRMELHDLLEHPEGLQMAISANGDNLSVGQRQLVCLARALLRRSRIFFLDEATASIDKQSDEVIQRTLRADAGARTVTLVTIAHRLETVLSSDLIIVMDDGKVAEFAPTSELVADPHSLFSGFLSRARLVGSSQ